MVGDLSDFQETSLLKYFAELTAISNLEALLCFLVESTPQIMGVGRCSIYLIPEYVPQYTGELYDSNLEKILPGEIKEDFIVLAQTNYDEKKQYIGRIYYESGQDLTGWVFKTGRTLNCKNSRDLQELRAIDPALHPSVGYLKTELDDDESQPRPILFLPLKIDSRVIGVLKLHKPLLPVFGEKAEFIANTIAQVISSLIQKVQIIKDQDKQILALAEMGTKDNPDELFKHVTRSAKEMFDCPYVELYLRSGLGDQVQLEYINGYRNTKRAQEPQESDGFIYWIFKTGKSIAVDDLHDFLDEQTLDDRLLTRLCGSVEINLDINDEDRVLRIEHQDQIREINRPIPFIGVPILANDDSVLGVLCAHFLKKKTPDRTTPFTLVEIQRLKTFASTISLAIRFSRMNLKGELLLNIVKCEDKDALFDLVQKQVPRLIHSTDCFIFQYERGAPKPLVFRNPGSGTIDLAYAVGEGKTAFGALANSTLVVDHFGYGKINQDRMEAAKAKYSTEHPHYLLHDLMDDQGNLVGIMRLECDKRPAEHVVTLFAELCARQTILREIGLPSDYLHKYQAIGSHGSYSFISVPILHDKTELGGVITLGRTSDKNPFAEDDVEFVKAISRTLASVIHNLNLLKQRNELIMSLAHEINTYITSIYSVAELIDENMPPRTELKKWSAHMLGQMDRLFSSSESILGVISQKKPYSRFGKHAIYRPLIEAVQTYREEANQKGCNIQDPSSKDHPGFPEIEMYLAELALAFKNIIHNAVKYSYRPSNKDTQLRFVRITGAWVSKSQDQYRVSIQNYGVGITEKEMKDRLIFQPFYRGELASDRQRTGSGFGLAYAAYVIEKLHHGTIEVECTRMGGEAHLTVFHIVLPVKQPSS